MQDARLQYNFLERNVQRQITFENKRVVSSIPSKIAQKQSEQVILPRQKFDLALSKRDSLPKAITEYQKLRASLIIVIAKNQHEKQFGYEKM